MKSTRRTITLCALALVLAAGATFGQGLLKKTYILTITVNVPGADIYIDNQLIKGNSAPVVEAKHGVRVRAAGYAEFTQVVDVKGNMTLPVTLRPNLYPLAFTVNVANATIYVDGAQVTNNRILVTLGSHTVQVAANGYKEYNSVVDISAPVTLPVVLMPAGFLLTVNANVADATVIVNNLAKGVVPYSEYLPPGGYAVRVSADGYADYIASIVLDRAPITVSAILKAQPAPQPLPATISLVIPQAFQDPEVRSDNPQGQVRVYIDNRLANPTRELDGIPVTPGRHRIRIASGAFSVQLGDITVQPGMKYIIELALDTRIRAVKTQE